MLFNLEIARQEYLAYRSPTAAVKRISRNILNDVCILHVVPILIIHLQQAGAQNPKRRQGQRPDSEARKGVACKMCLYL